MAVEPHSHPSFSPWRRVGIALNVGFLVLLVLSVVVMANVISHDFSTRFHLSRLAQQELSPLTLKFLQSVTNRVKVILYYDQGEPSYAEVSSLLAKYKLANSGISVENVDYLRDAGAAQAIKARYELTFPSATNLIIFDCEGRKMTVDGNALTHNTLEQIPDEKDRKFRRRPTSFEGEKLFSSALLTVTSPRKLNAYFLEGHGEHRADSAEETEGYLTFAGLAQQNYIQLQRLALVGTNTVPLDCNLLVIAGPKTAIPDIELEKIDQYLNQGGRLLALFNLWSVDRPTGLEKILAKWGVEVGPSVIKDPDYTYARSDVIVWDYGKHPLVNPLVGLTLHLIEPRSVGKLKSRAPAADAPRVDEVAFTGPRAYATNNPGHPQRFPLMVAVEKGSVKGVVTERGSTRMIVAGDSIFLGNHQIMSAANRDFAGCAINWLLDRTQLLEGLGPRPINEYKIIMTGAQLEQADWILLAGMPGAVLALGGLVWMRRRK